MTWHPGHWAALRPDHPAVILGSQALTYAELDARSLRIAQAWHAQGLAPRDTVALFMGNGPDFVCAAWAAQRSGLYYVAASSQLRPPELAHILADSAARALLTDAAHQAVAHEALRALPQPPALAWSTAADCPLHPLRPLAAVLAEPAPPLARQLEGADMLYTSGTTGRPKGVKRPLALDPLGHDPRRVERNRTLFGMDEHTVFYTPAPAYHAAPLRFLMTVLRMGGTVVLAERFDATAALDALATRRVTHSQWVPTMFSRLLALDPALRARARLAHHRVAIHSGAPCPVPLKQAMIDWWGPILHEYYSGSESIGLTHCDSAQWLAHPGTVGRPVGCTLHIVGDDGRELPPGETGTVYFEGAVRLQYHNDPTKTQEALHPRGWATMGDIGRVDADGFLYLSDRRSFVIVSGGVNIYPREIEDALATHPAVAEAAVFGLPDADFGEAVQAVVQLHDPAAASPALAHALAAHLRERLARFKCPKHIDFTDELPRVAGGKLHKSALRDAYRQRSERGHAVGGTRSQETPA